MSKKKKQQKKTEKRKPAFSYLGEFYTKMKPEEFLKTDNSSSFSPYLKTSAQAAEKLVAKDFYSEASAFLDLIYTNMHLYSRHIQNRFYIPFLTKKQAMVNKQVEDRMPKVQTAEKFFGMGYKDLKSLSIVNEERRIDLISATKKYAPTFKDLVKFWGSEFEISLGDKPKYDINDAPIICALISVIAHYQQIPAKKLVIREEFVKNLLGENPFHMYNVYAADIPLLGSSEIVEGCAVVGDIRIPGFLLRGNTIFYIEILLKENITEPILVTIVECISFYRNITTATSEGGCTLQMHPSRCIPFNSWDTNLMTVIAVDEELCSTMPLHATDIITLVPDLFGLLDFLKGVVKEQDKFCKHIECGSARTTNAYRQFADCRSLPNGKPINPVAYIISSLGPEKLSKSYDKIMNYKGKE